MQRQTTLAIRYLGLICLVFCLSLTALSLDGRDFSGSYRISHVSAQGNSVRLTLTVKLFNYSGGDIENGAVALYNSEPTRSPLGGFNAMPLFRLGQEANLSQQFIVPKSEYRRWQKGQPPSLFFLTPNPEGNVMLRGIQVTRELAPVQSHQ